MHTKFWSKSLNGRSKSEHLGIDGRIILKLILGIYGGGVCCLDTSGSVGPLAGCSERSNEPSVSVKGGGFLE
jgi:hypothetical protein